MNLETTATAVSSQIRQCLISDRASKRVTRTMTDASSPGNRAASTDDNASTRDVARVIRSEELFAGERIVLIQHAGEQYRLLITRNDRLILQK